MYVEIWLLVLVCVIIIICTAVLVVVVIAQDKDLHECYRTNVVCRTENQTWRTKIEQSNTYPGDV